MAVYINRVMKNLSRYFFIITLAMAFLNSRAQQFSVEPVIAQNLPEVSSKILVAPNPLYSSSYFYIQIDSCESNDTDKLIIYNSSGYMIQSKMLKMQNGDNRFLINISGFDPGSYIIRLVGKDIPSYSFSAQILVEM